MDDESQAIYEEGRRDAELEDQNMDDLLQRQGTLDHLLRMYVARRRELAEIKKWEDREMESARLAMEARKIKKFEGREELFRGQVIKLEEEILGIADGTEFRHPAGIASVVVKTKRRTWGKKIDIIALESPGMEGLLGPPSNWLIEIPATFRQRGMAEVEKTAVRLQLNDEARRLLFEHLDVRGGEMYTEIVIEETAMAVEEAIAAEREGK